MQKKYILTAYFENRFGKALKYFDGEGWHWMLNSDVPKLYENLEESYSEQKKLIIQLNDEVFIKEVMYFRQLWELIVPWEDDEKAEDKPLGTVYSIKERKQRIYLLSVESSGTKKLNGLYCVDRKEGVWIFIGGKGVQMEVERNKTGHTYKRHISEARQKMEDAKAIMLINGESEQSINKVDSVLKFVHKIDEEKIQITDDTIYSKSYKELIRESLACLHQTQTTMKQEQVEKATVGKVQGVILFVEKLLDL